MKRSRDFISVASLPKLCEGVEAGLHHISLAIVDPQKVIGFYRNAVESQAIPQVARQSAIPGPRGIARVSLEDETVDQLEPAYDNVRRGQGYEFDKKGVHPCFVMKDLTWMLIKVLNKIDSERAKLMAKYRNIEASLCRFKL